MRTFLVLLAAYTLSQFYRSFLAVVSGDLSRDLALGPAELGTMSGAWFAAFAVAQFPVGMSLDRFGPRRTLAIAFLAAVAGALWLSVARGYGEALVAMALIGAGCAPVLMAAMYVFAQEDGGARFAWLSSMIIGLGSLGNLAGTTPLAWAAASFGWRPALAAVAALTLAAAALVWLALRDPPRSGPVESWSQVASGLGQVLRLRALWPLLPVTAVSYAVVIAARSLWISPFLGGVHGLDLAGQGHAAFAMAIAMVVGALAYGPFDRLVGHKAAAMMGVLATAAAFVALGLVGESSFVLAVALLVAIGFCGMSYAVLMAHGRDFIPPLLLGRGVTFLNFAFIGGAGLVQSLSGLFVQASQGAGMPATLTYGRLHLAFGCALFAAAAIYALVPARPPLRSVAPEAPRPEPAR